MDIQAFWQKLKIYRDRIGMSLEGLADASFMNKSVLNKILNSTHSISRDQAYRLIQVLVESGAIQGQSQVFELLRLVEIEDFSEADWKAPPLVNLTPAPLSGVLPHQHLQQETQPAPHFQDHQYGC